MSENKRIFCRLEDCEVYELPEGRMFIGISNPKFSMGYLELNPSQELSKHKRPVPERLIQIRGTSTLRFYENEELIKEVVLNEGDKLEIPTNQLHIHANETNEKSLTFWRFKGDVTDIIRKIKESYPKIKRLMSEDIEKESKKDFFIREKKQYWSYKKGFRRKYKKL